MPELVAYLQVAFSLVVTVIVVWVVPEAKTVEGEPLKIVGAIST